MKSSIRNEIKAQIVRTGYTMGTTVGPTSMPQPCSSKYAIAPPAASKPKALPPLSMMAFTRSTRL